MTAAASAALARQAPMVAQHTAPPLPEPADHYRGWGLEVILAFDRLLNALAFGRGLETISYRIGRAMISGRIGHGYGRGWPRPIRRHCLWVYGVLPVLPCRAARHLDSEGGLTDCLSHPGLPSRTRYRA